MNTQKLSILFVTNNYTPYAGGVVSSILFYANALRKHGHTVTIVTLDFLPHYTHHEDHVIRLYCPLRWLMNTNYMAIPWQATKQIKAIIKEKKPHIIHVHHPFLLGKAAYRAGKQYTIPIVFTYHTLYEHYLHYIPCIPKAITKPLVHYAVKKFCSNIDGIIAPSSIIEERLEQSNITTQRALIPTGISEQFFAHQLVLPKKINKPLQLLTVSRFAKEKNITFLLDVIANLNPNYFKATFIGYGPEKKNLEKYAFHHKKIPPAMLTFIEKPPKEQLIQAYYHADLFLFASQSETQGLVLAEAMSQATPVIALDGPGQRDIIKHGNNGFLVHSPEEMQAMIEFLQKNTTTLHLLQKNAFETGQTLKPEKTTCSLLNFYYKLLTR